MARSTPTLADDRGIPAGLVSVALGVSLAVLVLGLACAAFGWVSTSLSSLTICVGFGILLVCFGTKAAGKYKNLSATGAGALAIALYLIVLKTNESEQFVKEGVIDIDGGTISDLVLQDDKYPFHHYNEAQRFHFVILKREFTFDTLYASYYDPRGKFTELEADSSTISNEYLKPAKGWEDIHWILDVSTEKITGNGKTLFRSKITGANAVSSRYSALSIPGVVTAAYAETTQPDGADIADLVKHLADPDAAVWRTAKDALAARGPVAVKPLMAALGTTASSDNKLTLGVIYTLVQMLRDDRTVGPAISIQLSDEDLKRIVYLLSNKEKSIRDFATEFLQNLKDTRTADFIITSMATDLDKLSLATKSVTLRLLLTPRQYLPIFTELASNTQNPYLSDEGIQAIANLAAAADTQAVQDSAQNLMSKYPNYKFNVIAASFPTKKAAEEQIDEYNKIFLSKNLEIKPEILAPTGSGYWGVTLGKNLNFDDAKDIRIKAAASGIYNKPSIYYPYLYLLHNSS
ncbi:MAG TPA: hypothetical protein VNV38_06025 [Stellaceae bacterium]|jgi:hypothetical protein|nr:hypothetical protein [Stellaceae bacterium]